MNDDFWIGAATILLLIIALSLVLILAFMMLDHYYKQPIHAVCSPLYQKGFWYVEGEYVRDMSYTERVRWCPNQNRP